MLPFISSPPSVNFRDIYFSNKYFNYVKPFYLCYKGNSLYTRGQYVKVMSAVLNMLNPYELVDLNVLPTNLNSRLFKKNLTEFYQKELNNINRFYSYIFLNNYALGLEGTLEGTSLDISYRNPLINFLTFSKQFQ